MKKTRISFVVVATLIYGIVLGSIFFSRLIVGGNGIYIKYISPLLILITMCLQLLALDLYAHYDLKKNNIFTPDDKLHHSSMKSNLRAGEIRNIKVEKKYKDEAEALAKMGSLAPTTFGYLSMTNIDYYKIARIFPNSKDKAFHNLLQFLCYKSQMKACGVEWNPLPFFDAPSYQHPLSDSLIFNSVPAAEEYLSKLHEKDTFDGCKYLIIRCVQSFDVAKETPGYVFQDELDRNVIVDRVIFDEKEKMNEQ